ncbi:MAG TPA: hypothetical protein VIT92_04445 [Burkholderiaceae bacterium]
MQKYSAFHVVLIAPDDYPHAEALSELVQTLVHGLQGLGYWVTAAINELSLEATNIVVGAHLLPAAATQSWPAGTIVYNTEQLIEGSSWLQDGALLDLFARHEVWDYSPHNLAYLRNHDLGQRAHLLPVGFVPELERIPRGAHDIDVLFYGSLNPRRQHVLDGLRARGLQVVSVTGVYGDERDALIARAKVVLNLHYYDSKIFEIVRVSYLLANRKAVVAEVGADTVIDDAFRDAVAGVPYEALIDTCCKLVADDGARAALEQRGHAIMAAHPQVGYLRAMFAAMGGVLPPLPRRINLGSGKAFAPSYFNIDVQAYWRPDLVADLSQEGALEKTYDTVRFGDIALQAGYFDRIEAYDVLEHVPQLSALMSVCLTLLREGGDFIIKVPYDLSYGAWQDPTHVRAFNERSWLYYTDWYWYMGWQEARFDEVDHSVDLSELGNALQAEGLPLDQILLRPRAVDSLHVTLRKRALTADEREYVRTYLRQAAYAPAGRP